MQGGLESGGAAWLVLAVVRSLLPAQLVGRQQALALGCACEAASAGGAEKSAKDPDLEYVVLRSFPSAAFARPGHVLVTSLFPEKVIGQQQTQDQDMWF